MSLHIARRVFVWQYQKSLFSLAETNILSETFNTKSQNKSSAESKQLTDLHSKWIFVTEFQILLFHFAENDFLTETINPQKNSVMSKINHLIETFAASCRKLYSGINNKPSKKQYAESDILIETINSQKVSGNPKSFR